MRKVPKDTMKLLKPHLDSGAIKLVDGSKHLCIVRADGHKRPLSGSPSDRRSYDALKSQLRAFLNPETATRRMGGQTFDLHS